MSIVVAIIALCVVIILHEAGHYLTALWTGMKVDRFSVFGIGPPIVKLGTFRGTEFVISAIPFGAYVLIRGMEPEDPDAEPEPASTDELSVNFRDKPLWARALVLLGGPGANYLTAMAIMFGIFTIAGVRGPYQALVINDFAAESSAQTAGIEAGDALVQIGETPIDPAKGVVGVNALTGPLRGETVGVTVARAGEVQTFDVTIPKDGPALGVGFEPAPRSAVSVGVAASKAVENPIRVTGQQLSALGGAVAGIFNDKPAPQLGGPVEIVRHISTQAESGLLPFLATTALISTLLGMFNLLPVPALDGGRLAFLGYEAIARRRASPRVEESVHGYGMLCLLILIAVISVGDIRRIPW